MHLGKKIHYAFRATSIERIGPFPTWCSKLICLGVLASALTVSASVAHGPPQITIAHAKRALQRFAKFTCPTLDCPHHTYACRRHTPLRVTCRSEVVLDNESAPRELCSWLGVATSIHGSTEHLRLEAMHFKCRILRSWAQ
jgi:hypothetical protein